MEKCLKDHLVKALFPTLDNTLGSELCWKRNYQFCKFIVNRDTFNPITIDETFKINKGSLNCNSKKNVFLWNAKNVKFVCIRLNNYKSVHKSFKTKKRET